VPCRLLQAFFGPGPPCRCICRPIGPAGLARVSAGCCRFAGPLDLPELSSIGGPLEAPRGGALPRPMPLASAR